MAKKLIIIDDSATQLNILKALFTNEGWEVCGVQNAKIGYEMIFDYAPDLIISDAIMPMMGGFQLLKLIRKNEKISKIPIIVYSVLNESNAKFYINEEYSEYFLKKDDNQEKLLEMAKSIVEKFPLSEEYKEEILKIGSENFKSVKTLNEELKEELENISNEPENEDNALETQINLETIKATLKSNNDFSLGDEKNFAQILNELYEALKYNLAILNVFSFENEQNKVFFDIKDIILSPIFRNAILNKHETSLNFMYKKYAPNLDTIMQESEFLSKIEFDFKYKENNIANITFYSREKEKWEHLENQEELKEALYQYFKTRYISKTQNSKKEDIINKYFSFNKFKDVKKELDTYFGAIQILNFSELELNLAADELDMLNSKISEKIIECIETNEQVYKNDNDEYNLIFFAKDLKHAKYRLDYILKEIEAISFNTYSVDSSIVAINCNIDGNFSLIEAQKKVRDFIEQAQEQEKVVVL